MDQRTTWLFLFLTPIWLIFHPAGAEPHSLTYIYTAFSKPVNLPGIHEFTAMGVLDGRMIDYYDSVNREKVPKQTWMKEKLEADYWQKGTRSRQSKEQWFKVNIGILMERMRQNDTDAHVLQWRHGCEIDRDPNGLSTFKRGMDMYSYDGNDFLSFNDADSNWIAPVDEALPTKRKWDEVQVLKDYTKGYLEKECVEWLDKFLVYGERELKKAIPPEVYVFAKTSKSNRKNVVLTCMATGFLPKDIIMHIKRDDRVVDEMDGLEQTEVRPNEDDTHQQRMSVEILQSDPADYTCEVHHPASNVHIVTKWDRRIVDCANCAGPVTLGIGIGVVIGGLAVVGVVMLLYCKNIGPFANRARTTKPNINPTPPLPVINGNNGADGIHMAEETVPLAAQPNGGSDSGHGSNSDGASQGSLESA